MITLQKPSLPVWIAICVLSLCSVPLDAAPNVRGFDRMKNGDVNAGRLLIGELGCVACHKSEQSFTDKQAPRLHGVGSRLNPEWLRAFIANPSKVKPGTAMPNLFAGMPKAEADEQVDALVHFLANTKLAQEPEEMRNSPKTGAELYHQIGCVACHDPASSADPNGYSEIAASLGDPNAKFATTTSLAEFLLDPMQLRPSGRMPKMNLTREEAFAIASYMIEMKPCESLAPGETKPGLFYQYYEGSWQKLPDFDKLEHVQCGTTPNIDIRPRLRDEQFGFRFTGFINVPKDGYYEFFTNSDDGSQLWINGRVVVDNDGIHGGTEKSGSINLKAGHHKIAITFFEQSGGEHVTAAVSGPGISKRSIPNEWLSHSGIPKKAGDEPKPVSDEAKFVIDTAKAARGKEIFHKIGCASCHALSNDSQLVPFAAPALSQLSGKNGGCLSAKASLGVPAFGLSKSQSDAIQSALASKDRQLTVEDKVNLTLASSNCYACHERGGIGGPVDSKNPHFLTSHKEMGDEARIPPHLNGVGGKLNKDWLSEVLTKGSKVRPYMTTRMPVFGGSVHHLVDDLESIDSQHAVPSTETIRKKDVVRYGREMAGTTGFACIACHTFGPHKSLGVPGMNMTLMQKRLKRGWFEAYLRDPQSLRPGTRMPTFWPGGVSAKPDLFEGNPGKQIQALWQYLELTDKAPTPRGLLANTMAIVAEDRARIYRNFIDGAGPRAIGIGYPGDLNLAFDANDMRLAMIWQGEFIDAAKHWTGRGQGFQGPMGYGIVRLPNQTPFANLDKSDAAWPGESGRQAGYEFRGYQLDKIKRPTFRYEFNGMKVEDFLEVKEGDDGKYFVRTLTLTDGKADNTYFRAALGVVPGASADSFVSNEGLTLKVAGDVSASVHANELRLRVQFRNGKAKIVLHYHW